MTITTYKDRNGKEISVGTRVQVVCRYCEDAIGIVDGYSSYSAVHPIVVKLSNTLSYFFGSDEIEVIEQ
jgi:hypothetical protein